VNKRPDEAFFESLQETKKQKIAAPVGAVLDTSGVFSPPTPVSSKNLFSHPDAHPVVLDMALLKVFQVEWFDWLSDTLFAEIEREFDTHINAGNRLKIMAAKTLHVIDAFWDHWEVFEKVIAGLNGIVPQVALLQPPDLAALYAGVDIASGIRQETYSDEVKRYCAAVFLHEGVTYAAPPLDFCQEYISQPIYRCRDCEQTGSALPPFDGHCPTCTQKYEQDKAFSLKPDPDMKDKTKGVNLEYHLTYESQPTKKRFEELSKLPAEQAADAIQETAEDVESARLIIATDFMKYRSMQLKTQLESLKGWLEAS